MWHYLNLKGNFLLIADKIFCNQVSPRFRFQPKQIKAIVPSLVDRWRFGVVEVFATWWRSYSNVVVKVH